MMYRLVHHWGFNMTTSKICIQVSDLLITYSYYTGTQTEMQSTTGLNPLNPPILILTAI